MVSRIAWLAAQADILSLLSESPDIYILLHMSLLKRYQLYSDYCLSVVITRIDYKSSSLVCLSHIGEYETGYD